MVSLFFFFFVPMRSLADNNLNNKIRKKINFNPKALKFLDPVNIVQIYLSDMQ